MDSFANGAIYISYLMYICWNIAMIVCCIDFNFKLLCLMVFLPFSVILQSNVVESDLDIDFGIECQIIME